MDKPITGIDHALLGVRDLEAARLSFGHLGFTLSPRGRHIGWGTANYCAMFRDSYIELLGIVEPAQFTNDLDTFLEAGEGLLGLAFATDDADAAARDLRARGIGVDGPKGLRRKLELPDGDVEPAFRTVHPERAATAGISAFVCQHLTPGLVWREEWLDHANGARGIDSVCAVVADPGAAALAHGQLCGEDAVSAGGAMVEVDTGGGRLRLCASGDRARLFPGVARVPDRAPPCLLGLRLAVADLGRTAGYFYTAGVPFTRDGERLLRLAPGCAHGAILEFVQGA